MEAERRQKERQRRKKAGQQAGGKRGRKVSVFVRIQPKLSTAKRCMQTEPVGGWLELMNP